MTELKGVGIIIGTSLVLSKSDVRRTYDEKTRAQLVRVCCEFVQTSDTDA